jgi:hypothetical protein
MLNDNTHAATLQHGALVHDQNTLSPSFSLPSSLVFGNSWIIIGA